MKRELRALRREHYELLDKLKEQEGAILRAQEQLEGLERLLINPLAAANAMVYFQLRHLWRVGAQRVQQFAKELELQREKRERAQLHEAALAKRKRRLDAIAEKMQSLAQKRRAVMEEAAQLQKRLDSMNVLLRLFRGPGLRRRLRGLADGRRMLEQKLEEYRDLVEKIQGEPLPELEGLSIESRRIVNAAAIALAQHLVVHFSEHDLATLAKTATQRAVGDMRFGDRRDCDRLVERIREKIEELRQHKSLADEVKRRADRLLNELRYRDEADTVPIVDCLDVIERNLQAPGNNPGRRAADAPLRINVLADDYWEIGSVLR
ncbi:MAG TPA: hypothetical protein VIN61_16570 [Gammaproteobacteria bacterium]